MKFDGDSRQNSTITRWHSMSALHEYQLDRSSPQPLYEQIKDVIVDLIDTIPLHEHEPIPSERELSDHLEVNRLTVRKAIDQLVEEGTLFRQQGKGTFVSAPKITQPLLVVRSFTDAMLQEGRVPGTRVHSVNISSGRARICRRLEIPVGDPVVELVRVRSVDNIPIALITSYLPRDLTSALDPEDFESISLYSVLREKCGIELVRSRVTLEPAVANHQEATLLNIQPGQPLMLLRGLVYTEADRVAEYSKAVYRGDKVRFLVESD